MVEKENFCRFSGILLDVGAKVLRETFMDKYVGSNNFTTYLMLHRLALSKLLNGNTLRQEQFDLLYPPSGGPASKENLDITLLCLLFRNLDANKTPSDSVWTNPSPTDLSYQADVARIRRSRNTMFGHHKSASIDATTFNNEITTLKTIYERLVMSLSSGLMSTEQLSVLINKELNGPLQRDQETEIERLREEIEKLHMHDIISDSGPNFLRLFRLILDVGTHTLQCYFENLCTSNCNLQQFLSSKKTELEELCRSKIIDQNEKDRLLCNNGCNLLLEDLTISLLIKLLINLCGITPPMCGWETSPEAGDKSPGADILRLRYAKKNLTSRPRVFITEAEFHKEWFNINEAVKRLSKQLDNRKRKDIRRKLEDAKQANICSDSGKGIRQLIFEEVCKQRPQVSINSDGHAPVSGSPNMPSDYELSDEDEGQIDEDIQMPQGEDGRIYIIKGYSVLKSELGKNVALDIAKKLFEKKNSRDVLEKMVKADRRPCIDCLLKRVLQEEEELLQRFIDLLKMKCLKIAKGLVENKVTEDDRIKCKQINERAERTVPRRTQNGCKIELSDIEFFQRHLLDFHERVDGINDMLLSQFRCSIWDHSKVTLCSDPNEKICLLFKTVQSCHFDSESELKNVLNVLESNLYEEWRQSKDNDSRQGLESQGIWHSLLQTMQRPSSLMKVIFRGLRIRFMQAEKGSLVLKFVALDNFDVDLLTKESAEEKVRDLIKTLCPEYQVIFKEPVHVTLLFKPPSHTDNAEIHFHLETRSEMKQMKESFSGKVGSREIDYMVEEMNPASLKKWLFSKLQIDKETNIQLVDVISWKDKSRRAKMKILLSTIESLKNGYELLEIYCKENDTAVYERVFQKHRKCTVEDNADAAQLSEKRDVLQTRFSIWIDFTEDKKDTQVAPGCLQLTMPKRKARSGSDTEAEDIVPPKQRKNQTQSTKVTTVTDVAASSVSNITVSESKGNNNHSVINAESGHQTVHTAAEDSVHPSSSHDKAIPQPGNITLLQTLETLPDSANADQTESVSDVGQVDEDSDSDIEEYSSMEQPPLIKQLKTILAEYPDDGQIIKELLQNAEDAGANEVKILYDDRCINIQKDNIKKNYRKFLRGPAICLFNDASFTESDWTGIKMIYSSVKEKDPLKVGRFGLGFKSVFHITDNLLVLSGDRILFMDPHRSTDCVCLTIPLSKLKKWKKLKIEDILMILDGTFGVSKAILETGWYNGTLFWFPLRSEASKLSDTVYSREKVMDLFTSFRTEASSMLVFLKHLTKVSLHERMNESNMISLKFTLELVKNIDEVKESRNTFLTKIRNLKRSVSDSSIDCRYRLSFCTKSFDGNLAVNESTTDWMVANYYKGGTMSEELRTLIQDDSLVYVPLVGVAAPVGENRHGFKGHVFCFLPLPQKAKSMTGLPVHVNGFFALSQNRQYIKWPSAEQVTLHLHKDKSLLWNEKLITEVLPDAYEILITEMINYAMKIGNPHELIQCIYATIPRVDSVADEWNAVLPSLFDRITSRPTLMTVNMSGEKSWISCLEAFLPHSVITLT